MAYAFNNVLIGEKEWNGFVENTCTVCNVEFEDENIHKTAQNHTMNLILKKVEFIEDKLVYRKIDESSFHCMTCNLVFSINILTAHARQENHLKNLEVRKAGLQTLNEDLKDTTVVETVKEQEAQATPTKINPVIVKKEQENNKVSSKDSKTNAKVESKKTEGSSKQPVGIDELIGDVLGIEKYVDPIAQANGKSPCFLCDMILCTLHECCGFTRVRWISPLHSQDAQVDKKYSSSADVDREPKVDQKATNDKPDDDRGKIRDSLAEFKNDIKLPKYPDWMLQEFNVKHIQEHKKPATKEETKPASAAEAKVKSESTKK